MGCEIERKFLVANDSWKIRIESRTLFRQGYVPTENRLTTRVRICGDKAFLTLKSMPDGISRLEFEYPIPLSDAELLLERFCAKPQIEKYRSIVIDAGHRWEIDEFLGENAGLVIAELELKSEEESFPHPDFLGKEVTGDHRYSNSNLVAAPYSRWTPHD